MLWVNWFIWISLWILYSQVASKLPYSIFTRSRVSVYTHTLISLHCSTVSLGELVRISDCTCPGYELKLQCTVPGVGFTEWIGTALDDDCTIMFAHSSFEPGKSGGSCNDGGIVGHWIEKYGGQNYTSQLTIQIVNTTLAGKSVVCIYNNGSREVIIGEHVIILTTGMFLIINHKIY